MVERPNMPQQAYQYPPQQGMPLHPDIGNIDFSNALPDGQNYNDPNVYDNNLSYGVNTSLPPNYGSNIAPASSTELVRRTRNQALAPQNGQQEQWNGWGNVSGQMEEEDDQELEMRAQMAKKDAQAKRKQIPPFVQKLSSFLDSNNTDLIRWSDDGRSFIVLDEDEFARTLIPELFKHNNYASFVRQLNMYGFHKTVNITDGSLRQSEKARKGVKPPSMYSHPYFRKNRPDLLWLIQKPTGKTTTAKRKRDGNMKGEYDSDEERAFSPTPEGRPHELSLPQNTSQDLAPLPRNELAAVRRELSNLQSQQKFISQMITQLKEQNDQFYRQATAFQALHDRHENSINAILTFLATFYNRSLDGHNAANLVNMFTNAQQNQQQQYGSVVEEYNDGTPTPTSNNQMQKFVRRPQLLLPGPASNDNDAKPAQTGNAVTAPNSARASQSPANDWSNSNRASAPPESANRKSGSAASASPVVKTDAPTPNVINQVPESSDQMMNLIHNVNATQAQSSPNTAAPANINLNSIVDSYQNGTPLTPQQRQNMMESVLQQGGANGNNTNNALVSPGQPFDFSKLQESNNQLEHLQRLQEQQDARVQELNRRLQPLSPTGTIPGLHDVSNQDPFDQLGAPGEYDPSAFLDFGDGSWDAGGGGDNDFDFGFDTTAAGNAGGFDGSDGVGENMFGGGGGGERLAPQQQQGQQQDGKRVESVSSEATSPAATVSEEPGTPNKRARRS